MKAILQKALPFIAALVIFIIASLAYFAPVLKGEKFSKQEFGDPQELIVIDNVHISDGNLS